MKKNVCRYHYQNLDNMIYSSWDIKQNILKLVIRFFVLLLPWKPQKSKFWKMKKFTGDIMVLHMCSKNHMMYSSWDTEWDRQNFLSIWAISWPFFHPPHPNDPKNQNFEKNKNKNKKNAWRYYPFIHTCVP